MHIADDGVVGGVMRTLKPGPFLTLGFQCLIPIRTKSVIDSARLSVDNATAWTDGRLHRQTGGVGCAPKAGHRPALSLRQQRGAGLGSDTTSNDGRGSDRTRRSAGRLAGRGLASDFRS